MKKIVVHGSAAQLSFIAQSFSDERSKEEKLSAAKAVYESALRRASNPAARAEAKEDYEATVKSINQSKDATSASWSVLRNGRLVFTGTQDGCVSYVADKSAISASNVRSEALHGGLVDDGQITWKIIPNYTGKAKDAGFTPAMIEALRKEWSTIRRIDPAGESYQRLTKLLDQLEQGNLKQLAEANIPFVSNLARNRVRRTGDANTITRAELAALSRADIMQLIGPSIERSQMEKMTDEQLRAELAKRMKIVDRRAKDGWGPARTSPGGPIDGSKIRWDCKVRQEGANFYWEVYDPSSGYVFETGTAKSSADAWREAGESAKTAKAAKIYDAAMKTRDADWNERKFKELKAQGVTFAQAGAKIKEADAKAAAIVRKENTDKGYWERRGRGEWNALRDESNNWESYQRWLHDNK